MHQLDFDVDVWEHRFKKYGTPVYNKLRQVLGMDKRSLAVFRIGVALVVLADTWNRSDELHAHYSDLGILNRALALEYFYNYNWVSIHMMSGSESVQAFLFLLHAFCALCMLVGYRTKLFTLLTWFMVVSIQSRNFLVGHGGDIVLRVYLFWSLFLPTGEYYSIDSILSTEGKYLKKKKKIPNNNDSLLECEKHHMVFNVGTVGLLCQIMFLYCFSVYHKTGKEWTEDNTATFYALQLDYFRKPFGDLLLMFPELLKWMTWAVLRWEFYGPFFLAMPVQTPYFKLLGVLGFFGLHMGFQLSMRLGIFGWICGFGVLCCLPTFFWDFIVFPLLKTKPRTGLKIFYSRCNPMGISESNIPLVRPKCVCKGDILADDECEQETLFKILKIVKTFFLLEETSIALFRCKDQVAISVDNEDTKYFKNNKQTSISLPTYYSSKPVKVYLRESDGTTHTDAYNIMLCILRLSPLLFPFYFIFKNQYVSTVLIRVINKLSTIQQTVDKLVDVEDEDFSGSPHYTTNNGTPVYGNTNNDGTFFDDDAILHQQMQDRRRRKLHRTKWAYPLHLLWDVLTIIAANCFAMLCLYICFTWNMGNIGKPDYATPEGLKWVALSLHLDQSWAMFSPRPPNTHWWYVIEGQLDDGTPMELFKHESIFNWQGSTPISWDKPDPFHASIKSHRWFKLYEMLNSNQFHKQIRESYAKYICREWNSRHEGKERLYTFKLWYLTEFQPLEGPREPRGKQNLWEHICYYKTP